VKGPSIDRYSSTELQVCAQWLKKKESGEELLHQTDNSSLCKRIRDRMGESNSEQTDQGVDHVLEEVLQMELDRFEVHGPNELKLVKAALLESVIDNHPQFKHRTQQLIEKLENTSMSQWSWVSRGDAREARTNSESVYIWGN